MDSAVLVSYNEIRITRIGRRYCHTVREMALNSGISNSPAYEAEGVESIRLRRS